MVLGYVVNDILDYEIDLINKFDKIIFGWLIKWKYVYWLFYFLVGLSLIVSFYLVIWLNEMEWIWFYFVFIGFLLVYLVGLKWSLIVGNVFVVLVCVVIVGLIWLGECKLW